MTQPFNLQDRPPEDDADDPLVKKGKMFGKAVGWAFMVYLVYSLGQYAKLW